MQFSKLLFSSLFAPITEDVRKNYSRSCEIPYDKIKVILYEAYIPIDALVFQIGTAKISKKEVEQIVNNVLAAKRIILNKPESVAQLFNMSSSRNSSNELDRILRYRQDLIKSDESGIFEDLIKNNLEKILNCIDFLKEKKLFDPKKDKEYLEMAKRLYDAIYENMDISESIKREKNEFYRKFKPLSKKQIRNTKIAVSLGGSIVNLPDLLYFVSKLKSKNKEILIRDWMHMVFEAIETLSIKTASKEMIDQKNTIINFIKESGDEGGKEVAYDIRTAIFNALGLKKNEKESFMKRQRISNSKLIESIKNITDSNWIVKYNRQIKEDMIDYLISLKPADKKRVLYHFN